ncbi:MAG: Flp family type IVb pilin [Hyphomicrobiales bacterium]
MLKVALEFLADEGGATAIEYAVISSGIGMVVLAGVDAAGKAVNNTFGDVVAALDGQGTTPGTRANGVVPPGGSMSNPTLAAE